MRDESKNLKQKGKAMLTSELTSNVMDALTEAMDKIGSKRFEKLSRFFDVSPAHRAFASQNGFRIQKNGNDLYIVKI